MPDPLVRELLRAEQSQVLYQQAGPALVISVVVSAIISLALWEVTDRRLLAGWFVTLAALAGVRLALLVAYRRRMHAAGVPVAAAAVEEARAWERRFMISLLATGAAWGVGAWLILPAGLPFHQAVVYFFLVSMAGGAIASYSAHAGAAWATVCLLLAPTTAWFAVQEDLIPRLMAVGGILYMAAAFRATKALAFFVRRSFQLSHELRMAHEASQEQARTDPLTGMRNRRAFYELGELAVQQAARSGRPLSVVILDLDHFKQVNDAHGHATGDEVLRALAGAITATARASDVSGRVGGEEFAIALPDTNVDEAAVLAERMRRRVSELAIPRGAAVLRVTASFGVAQYAGAGQSLDALLAAADGALYEAKAAGRNRVVRGSAAAAPAAQKRSHA